MTNHLTRTGPPIRNRNSPIFDEHEDPPLDIETESGACYGGMP
jgi:hypothetical protein